MSKRGRYISQLNDWVDGESKHNKVDNVCCPDFSCCVPEMMMKHTTRKNFRKAFLSGNNALVLSMLDENLKELTANVSARFNKP